MFSSLQSMRGGEKTFFDNLFVNEIRRWVTATDSAYGRMMYREAAQTGFFSLQQARDRCAGKTLSACRVS